MEGHFTRLLLGYWKIRVRKLSRNEKGDEVIYEGEDLLGRVLQHEYDHLQGQLLLKQLKRKLEKKH